MYYKTPFRKFRVLVGRKRLSSIEGRATQAWRITVLVFELTRLIEVLLVCFGLYSLVKMTVMQRFRWYQLVGSQVLGASSTEITLICKARVAFCHSFDRSFITQQRQWLSWPAAWVGDDSASGDEWSCIPCKAP